MRDDMFWDADSWGSAYPKNGYEEICEAANELIIRSNNPAEFSDALWELCCRYAVIFDDEEE